MENFETELSKCCGSVKWLEKMISGMPFISREKLTDASEKIWFSLHREDWLEAFSHHPKIGDLNSMKEKFAQTKSLAENEQSGVRQASEEVISELCELNKKYEERFGYIFIVCATGKSADEMLEILKVRIKNSPEEEIKIAAAEQNKITKIRLEKLL